MEQVTHSEATGCWEVAKGATSFWTGGQGEAIIKMRNLLYTHRAEPDALPIETAG